MSQTLVMKFGGTSVGGVRALRQLIGIVRTARETWPRVAVVVSAMSGVTDTLLAGAQRAVAGDEAEPARRAAELRQRHVETLEQLARLNNAAVARAAIEACLQEFQTLCHAVRVLGEASPRALDAIASLGERMSAPLVAAALTEAGVKAAAVDAARVVVTDAAFQAASPDMEATQARAEAAVGPLLETGTVPVITGFVGATPGGAVTTLGRGGSDYSAAILGVALEADEVWIWTDVDGVMTADPRVAQRARTLAELTFREVSELAFYGAKVLHPKAIRPVVERRVTLWVKNTFNPQCPGTRVVPDNGQTPGSIKAVTAFKGQVIITLEGRGMIGIPGIAARTFAAVARTGTSVAMISQASSEQSICFVVPCASAEAVQHALEEEFRHELARRDIDSIASSEETAVVTVVGAGMRHTPGLAGQIFTALGQAGVNVIAIAQGSSECSISLVVLSGEADSAVRAVHTLIVGED
ncbi:MAG: aspartate kinase [Anaerolineales bacterium]|nr:aspartate kinase [Anaerolineales bacterium]